MIFLVPFISVVCGVFIPAASVFLILVYFFFFIHFLILIFFLFDEVSTVAVLIDTVIGDLCGAW